MSVQHYETYLVFTPALDEATTTQAIDEVTSLLKKEQATIVYQSEAKLRSLAYPIKKSQNGLDIIIEYQAPSSTIAKLETMCNRNGDKVLRYLTTKLDRYGVDYRQKQRDDSLVSKQEKIEVVDEQEGSDQVIDQDSVKKKRYCRYCKYDVKFTDYSNPTLLKNLVNPQAKILSRRYTGSCAKHHKRSTRAVKKARHLALQPYITDNFN